MVAILSTIELNKDSILRKEEMELAWPIELSMLLIADATLWTSAAMTLISEAALLASSQAMSMVAKSAALIWLEGVSLWDASDRIWSWGVITVMKGTEFEGWLVPVGLVINDISKM